MKEKEVGKSTKYPVDKGFVGYKQYLPAFFLQPKMSKPKF